MVEIRVLGGLSLLISGERQGLGTPKQRTVLAMFALHPGRLVTPDELVDELWGANPPRSALPNIRTYAASLRRTFDATDEGRGALVREGSGYRLELPTETIDSFRFMADHHHSRKLVAEGELDRAEAVLERAMSEWRGSVLAGMTLGPVLATQRVAIEEERALAVELLADLQSQQGRAGRAVPLLRRLIAEHPLRESARLLLMRVLQRNGDTAGLVEAYHEARHVLHDQLGVEPGAEIQALYEAELGRVRGPNRTGVSSHDEDRLRSASGPGITGERAAADWLPRTVIEFVGRKECVSRLLSHVSRVEGRASAVLVVDGMAGSGKTTVALHVARKLAPKYRDAQLFIDLQGHGDEEAIEPFTALFTLLRQLGVPGGRIPADLDHRVELWRRELAARRVVVVLDNVADSSQILPLLPTAPGAAVLVTSRRRLADLDVGPPESLPLMTLAEGMALLSQSGGIERVASEPDAAAEVVRRCGYLPLAIRLAGSRLAHRPARRVSDLAALLAAEPPSVDQLHVGDRTLARAFAASYEPIPEQAKRAFRLLSIHAGQYSAEMVAALLDLPRAAAVELLDDLVDRHLVEEIEGGRYRLHNLLRQYSRAQLLAADGPEATRTAVRRLLDFALHASLEAAKELHQAVDVRGEVDPGLFSRPDLTGPDIIAGVEWLERERINLAMLVGLGAAYELHHHVWKLSRVLWRFLYVRGYFDDILYTQELGLASAKIIVHQRAIGTMHNYLASALAKTGSHRSASDHLHAAIALFQATDDVRELAKLRANLSVVNWLSGNLEEAVALGRQSLAGGLYDNRVPLALPNLGLALASLGRWDEAMTVHRHHLFQARLKQDYYHLANALSHLAAVRVRLGQFRRAVILLSSSLALFRRTGHRYGEAEARNTLGAAYRGLGQLDLARRQHEAAFELANDSGERHAQCAALNDLGMTLLATGELAAGSDALREGLRLAGRISNPYEQGRALAGLAEHFARTDRAEARRHWERALAIFRRMGVPERFEVERRLAELGTTAVNVH
ncbi:BTAD domain-containing putative transcriptional regulator [Micromonospora sp. NPDC093244]|uniref:AfsR/SARP family transcriptional regulator n=1 Tax=Micromonospora sp. NPDC093244 TaxID=3155071 RepID=UPI003439B3D2